MSTDRQWAVPLTGLAFVISVVAGFLVPGQTPDATKDSAQEIVSYFAGHDGAFAAADILVTAGALLAVFFGAYLRRALREGRPERDGDLLPLAAFAGTVIFATGLALDDTARLALSETAGHIDPTAVQALAAFYQHDFVVFGVGLEVLLLATGVALVRDALLPRWLGWAAIALAVLAVTPAGFFGFLGGMLLVAIISVMLTLRARTGITAVATSA
jgi:hypothetical protein